ncbi:hypothetical protein [uncultured Polaribacter sp.]|nr:hypothetical protein [uncultured Polaribacter sp.]
MDSRIYVQNIDKAIGANQKIIITSSLTVMCLSNSKNKKTPKKYNTTDNK